MRLLRNRRNLGFAKAVNRGVMTASSEWVLLLNPDVTVEDGFLDRALALIDELPATAKVGAVGFQLRNADGTPQASTGRFPTFLRTLSGLLRPRSRRKCQHQSLVERDPVDWATGGCLLSAASASTTSAGSMNGFSSTTKTLISACGPAIAAGRCSTTRGSRQRTTGRCTAARCRRRCV